LLAAASVKNPTAISGKKKSRKVALPAHAEFVFPGGAAGTAEAFFRPGGTSWWPCASTPALKGWAIFKTSTQQFRDKAKFFARQVFWPALRSGHE